MGITYFNWEEIRLRSNNDITAILCLAYGQTLEYNELSSKTMMEKLKIHHIAPHLFHRRHFIQHSKWLACNYKTIEPQNYFKNSSFLYLNAPAMMKAAYIKALGLRRISETVDYIPLSYFPNIKPSFFVEISDDKIHFKLESSC